MDKSKSKKVITLILIISAILGLAAIATSYYFTQIRDVTPGDSSAANGCGCYFVDTSNGVSSCTDANPKMAFAFKTGTIQSDGSCSANCDLRLAPATVNSDDEQIIKCEIATGFSASPGCIDLSLQNSSGNIITNEISPDQSAKVSATFNVPQTLATDDTDFYKSFSIVVNGERTNLDVTDVAKTGSGKTAIYTASTDLTDLGDSDTLTLQAFGSSVVGTEYTSSACLRELKVTQSQVPICRTLDVSVDVVNDIPKVDELTIETSSLGDVETLSVEFTLGDSDVKASTKDLTSKYLAGTVLLDQDFLYSSSNFTTNNNFSELDDSTNSVDLSAVLIVNGESIDSDACTTSEKFTTVSPSDDVDPDQVVDGDDEEEEDPDVDPDQVADPSAFMTSKDADIACIERTAPNNEAVYTITITNDDDAFQDIASIVDKLPLGFEYVEESTEINGVAVDDVDYLTVTTVGSSQQLTWETEDGWSVASEADMTITYTAIATADALTGDALNEVVVTPANTPTDPDSLRAEVSIDVAQSCTAPETGLFDDTQGRIIFSVMVIVFGAIFAKTGFGIAFSEKLAGNSMYMGMYKTAQMFGWKLTDPRRYFEERSISKIEKKRRKKTN